jgi:hypothetical protein
MENLMVKMKEYLHKFKIPIPVPNDWLPRYIKDIDYHKM